MICWDNDFRCTGHFHAPALLQHLCVILLTLQTGKLRHRAGSGDRRGSRSISSCSTRVLHGCWDISITHNLAELPKVPKQRISCVPSVPSSAAMSCWPWSLSWASLSVPGTQRAPLPTAGLCPGDLRVPPLPAPSPGGHHGRAGASPPWLGTAGRTMTFAAGA